jgi:beta-glucosidase
VHKILPLKPGIKIFIKNIDPAVAAGYGTVVKKPEQADVAVIRINAPSQYIKGTGPFGRLFRSGDLDFKEKDLKKILDIVNKLPALVDIYLDRPAVIPEIAKASAELLANFGCHFSPAHGTLGDW